MHVCLCQQQKIGKDELLSFWGNRRNYSFAFASHKLSFTQKQLWAASVPLFWGSDLVCHSRCLILAPNINWRHRDELSTIHSWAITKGKAYLPRNVKKRKLCKLTHRALLPHKGLEFCNVNFFRKKPQCSPFIFGCYICIAAWLFTVQLYLIVWWLCDNMGFTFYNKAVWNLYFRLAAMGSF